MTINFPKSWANITVNQFKEIYSIKIEDFTDIEDYYAEILSILADISLEEIGEIEHNKFIEHINDIKFIFNMPTKPPKNKITTKAGDFYLKDNLQDLTIGEFIDIENLLTQNHIQNLNSLISIFYRKKIKENDLLYLDVFEPYGNWIYHRAPLFDEVMVNDIYGIINKYLIFRKDFFERYSGLFDENSIEDEDVNSEEENDSISKSEKMKEDEKQKNIKKWSWDVLIYRLAKNDPIKFEEATTMSLIQAFNIFSMKKELGLE